MPRLRPPLGDLGERSQRGQQALGAIEAGGAGQEPVQHAEHGISDKAAYGERPRRDGR